MSVEKTNNQPKVRTDRTPSFSANNIANEEYLNFNKQEDEEDLDSDKYLAEKTGLLWIYDAFSPTDDK